MKKVVVVFLVVVWIQAVAGQPECFIPPQEGSDDIVIIRVQYAATYINDEYIVIFNKGDITVDLSGWVVFTSYYEVYRNLPLEQRTDLHVWRNVYRIPSGFKLKPKYWVRISSGRGTDNELYLYRNLGEQWLVDEGDVVYLMDNGCTVIDQYSWP
jgi:hypothetical protein